MKLSTKAISSPARTEKFPPPLMRFLRTNAGSRSRRSRSSPMFVHRKKNNNNNIETTLEPSSPKVTCMGQVRARHSSKTPSRRCCCRSWWIRKPNLCQCWAVWPKWNFFRRKSTKPKQEEYSVKSESNFHQEERISVDTVDIDTASFASISSTPPKNALLLTRCRSAPYRSSSLGSRFWSSPLRSEEEEEEKEAQSNSNESSSQSQSQRHSTSEEESLRERIASTITNSENAERECEEEARPVVLTRCKSEPARTGERFDSEVNIFLWKKRKLGFADITLSPLHMLSD